MSDLAEKTCQACEGGVSPLEAAEAASLQKQVPQWQLDEAHKVITRTFSFKGYYKTIAFVNAIAWIAQQQGHHPDLEVSFGKVVVHFSTHAVSGLTENDFICAAKVDNLIS